MLQLGTNTSLKKKEKKVKQKREPHFMLFSPVSAPQTHDRMNQLFHSITLSGPVVAATVSNQFNGPLLCILTNTQLGPQLFLVSFFSPHSSQLQ